MQSLPHNVRKQQSFSGVIINKSDIVFLQHIKSGTHGSVYRGRVGNTEVAVKETKFRTLDEYENAQKNLKKEVQILSDVHHENICLFLGACLESDKIILVSELCVKDLEEYMKEIPSLFDRVELSRDICKGMSWLHDTCGIVHHDLKPANLLVNQHYRLKITDFGFSQILPTNKFSKEVSVKEKGEIGGTPRYMAPERFFSENEVEGIPGDVYSFGIILWEMITLKVPFSHYQDMESFVKGVASGDRPSLKLVSDVRLQEILKKCWSSNPRNRPSFRTILSKIDNALVCLAINDAHARQMWVNTFSQSPTANGVNSLLVRVPWTQFVCGLQGVLNTMFQSRGLEPIDIINNSIPDPTKWVTDVSKITPESDLRFATDSCLEDVARLDSEAFARVQAEFRRRQIVSRVYAFRRVLCDEKEKDIVDIQRFGKVINILGWGLVPNSDNLGVLDNVFSLCQKKWFHPWASKDEAYEILKQSPNNTIVFRFSQSADSAAVSMVVETGPPMPVSEKFGVTAPRISKSVIHLLLNYHPDKGWAKPKTHKWAPTIQELLQNELSPEQASRVYFNMKELWDSGVGADDIYYSGLSEDYKDLMKKQHKYDPKKNEETHYLKEQMETFLTSSNPMLAKRELDQLKKVKKDLTLQVFDRRSLTPKDEENTLLELGKCMMKIEFLTHYLDEMKLDE